MTYKHTFETPDGGTRYAAAVGDFETTEIAPGGFESASGNILAAEVEGHPDVFREGAVWRVHDQTSGEIVFAGKLLQPGKQGGTYQLAARGWATLAETAVDRLLFATEDMDLWSAADAEPHDYSGATNMSDKLSARISGGKGRVVWRVRRGQMFKRKAGNPSKWGQGVVFWAPEQDLARITMTLRKQRNDSDYDVELLGATGPDGNLTLINSWTLGAANPSTLQVDQTITSDHDLLMLRMVRLTETKKARPFRAWATNIRVYGIATDDEATTGEVVREVAGRLGADDVMVQEGATPVLPYDVADGDHAEVLTEMAVIEDYRWLLLDRGNGPAMDFGPWDRTWTLPDPEAVVNLVPMERFTGARIPYNYPGGHRAHLVVDADPNPLPGYTNVFDIPLDDPLPPEDVAQAFAENAVGRLAEPKQAGTATLTTIRDASGVEYPATRLHAGDILYLPHHGGHTLRVREVRRTDTTVEVTFDEGHVVLERWLARRRLRLAQGRKQAAATLADSMPAAPAAPATVVVTFPQHVVAGKKVYHTRVTWAEVTDDIEGNATAIDRYVVQVRNTNNAGTPISSGNGGHTHKRTVDDRGDDVDPNDETDTTKWSHIHKPKLWFYQARARAIDIVGRKGPWTAWSTPANATGLQPKVIPQMDGGSGFGLVWLTWEGATDDDQPDLPDPGLSHYEVEVHGNATYTNLVYAEKFLSAEQFRFETSVPVYVRVRPVSADGEFGDWAEHGLITPTLTLPPGTSIGDGVAPPTPTDAPIITREVATLILDMGAYTKPSDFQAFLPEWQQSLDGGTTWTDRDGTVDAWTPMGPTGAIIPHGQRSYDALYRYRFRVVDVDDMLSGYSPTTNGETPRRVGEPYEPGGEDVIDIEAGTVDANMFRARLAIIGKQFTTSDDPDDQRVEFDGSGIRWYRDNGAGGVDLRINFPTAGNPAIEAVLTALGLQVTGDATFEGLSTLAGGAFLDMLAGVANPTVAPTVANTWDQLQLAQTPEAQTPLNSLHYVASPRAGDGGPGWYACEKVTGGSLVEFDADGAPPLAQLRSKLFGSVERPFSAVAAPRPDGTWYTWAVVYNTNTNTMRLWRMPVGNWSSATVLSIPGPDIQAGGDTGGITWNGTNLVITSVASAPFGTAKKLRIHRYTIAADALSINHVSTVTTDIVIDNNGASYFGWPTDLTLEDVVSQGGKLWHMVTGDLGGGGSPLTGNHVRATDASDLESAADRFSAPTSPTHRGIGHDGVRFWTLREDYALTKHTNWLDEGLPRIRFTWHNNASGAESARSPEALINHQRRARISITTPPFPVGADRVRVYSGGPGITGYDFQHTSASRTSYLDTLVAGGVEAPVVSTFGATTNAAIRDAAGNVLADAAGIRRGVTGTVDFWPLDTPPAGALLCNGTVLAISTYPRLGALLGSKYGGNGTTTFGVPNLTGANRVIRASTTAGGTGGAAAHTHSDHTSVNNSPTSGASTRWTGPTTHSSETNYPPYMDMIPIIWT